MRFERNEGPVVGVSARPRTLDIPELKVFVWCIIVGAFLSALAWRIAAYRAELDSRAQDTEAPRDATGRVLALLLKHAPPGNTAFSVEPAQSGMLSSFYRGPVVRESAETGRARYAVIADELVHAARDVIASEKPRGAKLWREHELVATAAAIAIYESGLREDVQVGRGSAKTPDDVGGRGRGPSQEACLLQIHPKVFPTFAPGGAPSLLGLEPGQVGECLRAGMRMLIRARAHCTGTDPGGKVRGFNWVWATVAMYGTGNSCVSDNHGKTGARVSLARRLLAEHGSAR